MQEGLTVDSKFEPHNSGPQSSHHLTVPPEMPAAPPAATLDAGKQDKPNTVVADSSNSQAKTDLPQTPSAPNSEHSHFPTNTEPKVKTEQTEIFQPSQPKEREPFNTTRGHGSTDSAQTGDRASLGSAGEGRLTHEPFDKNGGPVVDPRVDTQESKQNTQASGSQNGEAAGRPDRFEQDSKVPPATERPSEPIHPPDRNQHAQDVPPFSDHVPTSTQVPHFPDHSQQQNEAPRNPDHGQQTTDTQTPVHTPQSAEGPHTPDTAQLGQDASKAQDHVPVNPASTQSSDKGKETVEIPSNSHTIPGVEAPKAEQVSPRPDTSPQSHSAPEAQQAPVPQHEQHDIKHEGPLAASEIVHEIKAALAEHHTHNHVESTVAAPHPTTHKPSDLAAEDKMSADQRVLEMVEKAMSQENQQAVHNGPRPEVIDQIGETAHKGIDPASILHDALTPLAASLENATQISQNFNGLENPLSESIMNQVSQNIDDSVNRLLQIQETHTGVMPNGVQAEALNVVAGLINGQINSDLPTMPGLVDEMSAADALIQLGSNTPAHSGVTAADFQDTQNPFGLVADALGLSNSTDPVSQLEANILNGISPAIINTSELDPDEILRLRNKKELDDKTQDEKERREHDERVREEEAKRYAAAMLAALKARQAQEESNRTRAQKDLLNLETRQQYIVVAGDTLESIAQRRLFNGRLAPLIFEINKARISVNKIDGKQVLDLKPKTVLQLPTQMEVKRFQARVFGPSFEKFEYVHYSKDNSPASKTQSTKLQDPQAAVRKNNVESVLGKIIEEPAPSDGRIRYMVRLGDSLRSICMRHPAIKDSSIWKLFAEINKLSTEVDSNGNPVEVLKRGQTLILPMPNEIAAYHEKQRALTAAPAPKQVNETVAESKQQAESSSQSQATNIAFPSKEQPISAPRFGTYTGNADSVDDIDVQLISYSGIFINPNDLLKQGSMVHVAKAEQVSDNAAAISAAKPAQAEDRQAGNIQRNLIKNISEECRIVSFGNMTEGAAGFRSRLEYKQNEFWLPVILYEINAEGSQRHEYSLNGSRISKRIELPTAQARQLAKNDIEKNWEQYIKNFLRNPAS